jgi:hypothetical protein
MVAGETKNNSRTNILYERIRHCMPPCTGVFPSQSWLVFPNKKGIKLLVGEKGIKKVSHRTMNIVELKR